ncbi:hypothetical protein M514_00973 [Trichuris suis]|uniref:Uncharacterized protein n=1 Tax=Trichuris suis TaxID=68888 RepID=A0A085NLX9_9BILA|nr:hypothetical protein M513_00973 [Trichuris suis]KFD70475.1 hypothetical protein M514_00973 [Trichuris suis]
MKTNHPVTKHPSFKDVHDVDVSKVNRAHSFTDAKRRLFMGKHKWRDGTFRTRSVWGVAYTVSTLRKLALMTGPHES